MTRSSRTDITSSTHSNRVVGLFPELLGVGGVQEAGRQTVTALDEIAREHGWSLSVLSLNEEPGMHAISAGTREIPLNGFGREKIRFALSAMTQAANDAQIVIAGHPHLALPLCLMKLRNPALKTIVMSHGIEVWKPLSTLRRRALGSCDAVLAPSTDTARKLADVQGVSWQKIHRLAWPVNANVLRLSESPDGLPLPPVFPNGTVVLTVGRWAASERYKGADDLIEAVAQLQQSFPDLHLVAVGAGDDLPRLRHIASERGIAHRVVLLEGLTREEIASCYAHCDLFALPSAGEGFGIVFLEAMAFGKSVIGAASGGIPDLVENGANGLLIPAHDRQRLTEALAELLRDRALRQTLGTRGAEMVRSRYTFTAFKNELTRILTSLSLRSEKSH